MKTDYYVVTDPWYYVLNALTVLYGAAYIACTVLTQNANIPNTVFPPNMPWGTFYTQVYNSLYWLTMFLACWRILMYPLVNNMILYRRTCACVATWFCMMFVIAVMDLIAVVGSGSIYGAVNQQGQTFNPGNDPDWCCVTAIYQLTSNGCSNSIACPASFPTLESELGTNVDFLWFFYTNLGFLIMDLLFIAIFFYFLFAYSTFPTAASIKRDADDENDPLRSSSPSSSTNTNTLMNYSATSKTTRRRNVDSK